VMTVTPVPRLDISSLPVGDELGSGGQGRVSAVGGFLINGRWPAAVKVYSADVLDQIDPAALEEIVGLPRLLSPDDSAWLYENTAWPAAVVENAGQVCGFLMRAVPEEYYFDFQTRTRGTQAKLADMAFLLNSDQYVSGSGLSVSERDRLALLKTLAMTLSRLHALDICVGDLSPKNLLFSLAPAPHCFTLDCDAMRVRGQTVLPQIQTPDWEVPDGEATATTAADACKFGLLAIRLFARDQSSRNQSPLAAVAPELGRLAELSQDPDPLRRPVPGAWITALDATASFASTAPASGPEPAASSAPIAVLIPPVGSAEPHLEVPLESPPVQHVPPRRRWLKPAVAFGSIAAVAGAAALAVSLIHSPAAATSPPPARASTPVTGSAGGASTPTTPAASASDEAAQINSLLNSSSASRSALVTAVNNVGTCTGLSSDVSEIQDVASQRSAELSEASGLSTGALPSGAALQSDLTAALRYSMLADNDFAQWAQQMLNDGCSDPAPQTPAYMNGFSESKKAGLAKTAFLQLWNPIASQQGLPARGPNFI